MTSKLLLAATACCATGCFWPPTDPPPMGACLALGFGEWSPLIPTRIPIKQRAALPLFRLSSRRARWISEDTWYEVRPVDSYQRIGRVGWETLNAWLAPSPDSLILFRPGSDSWGLYIALAWHADTARGRAIYRGLGELPLHTQAHAYAVRYDCTAPGAVVAAGALYIFFDADVPLSDSLPPVVLPPRAQRVRAT
jgi:hypothetical protein